MPPVPYSETHVRTFSFVKDDSHAAPILEKLGSVLEERYGATTVTNFEIPSQNPHTATSQNLNGFMTSYAAESNLLIICYAGRGWSTEAGGLVWTAYSPELDWSQLQAGLVRCASDVLIILNCCSAGAAATDMNKGFTNREGGTTELMLSCTQDRTCAASRPGAFLNIPVDILETQASTRFLKPHHKAIRLEDLDNLIWDHVQDMRDVRSANGIPGGLDHDVVRAIMLTTIRSLDRYREEIAEARIAILFDDKKSLQPSSVEDNHVSRKRRLFKFEEEDMQPHRELQWEMGAHLMTGPRVHRRSGP
ncbi:hypothetical protein VTL71DRAFT_16414 [Oculimacula yallundae]|uniref:CHAT domain-containing protein n=1 Tax=Oculimacula yallundae TaxID=86028 RepID=A0ABR4CFP5_9HELO